MHWPIPHNYREIIYLTVIKLCKIDKNKLPGFTQERALYLNL